MKPFAQIRRLLRSEKTLLPCSAVFGNARICDEDPLVQELSNVLYVPMDDAAAWGLFNSEGQILEAAVNYYGEPPVAKQPTSSILPQNIEWSHEGKFLYAGVFNPHFGHFMVDTLTRLWCIKSYPGVKLLFHGPGNPDAWFERPYVAAAFAALKLRPEDMVVLESPTKIRELILPGVGFREHSFAHRIVGSLFKDIGAHLDQPEPAARGRVIYLSKSEVASGIGGFENEFELDQELAKLGVDVVHPERLSLEQHVGLFGDDRVVMGTVGSALHPSVMARHSRIVGLSPTPYLVSNFVMLDRLSGANAVYFHCPKTAPTPSSRFQLSYLVENPRATARALASIGTRLLPA